MPLVGGTQIVSKGGGAPEPQGGATFLSPVGRAGLAGRQECRPSLGPGMASLVPNTEPESNGLHPHHPNLPEM